VQTTEAPAYRKHGFLPFALSHLGENRGEETRGGNNSHLQLSAILELRGQNMDLFRLLVELLGKRGDRLDHMLTSYRE